jgi:DNA-binding response OmpR family regulator
LKILIVEDNLDIKEVLDYILKDDGHEVASCPDGSSLTALDRIKPDLILMDDKLAEVRGSDLCLQLKNNDTTKNIPVIIMSAMPNLQEIARKCLADAYLEKPFNIEVITELIEGFSK